MSNVKRISRRDRIASYVKKHGNIVRFKILDETGKDLGFRGHLKTKEGKPVYVTDKQEFANPSQLFSYLAGTHLKKAKQGEKWQYDRSSNSAVALTGTLNRYQCVQLSSGATLADIAPSQRRVS